MTLNLGTGAVTSTVALNSQFTMTSLAWDSVTNKLYGNTTVGFGDVADNLYEIDPATGITTLVGAIGFENVYGLGFDTAGTLFGTVESPSELISLDLLTGAGTSVAGLRSGPIYDIAARPSDNVMFGANSGDNSLYTLDTTTGGLVLVGPYVNASNIVRLSFAQVPEPGTWALLATGLGALGLAGRRRR